MSEQKLTKALNEANKEISFINEKHLNLTKLTNGAIDKEQSLKRALDEVNNDLDVLKEKNAKLEDIAKEAEELEYERSRQISYLEKENLQVLGELKSTKKEYQKLKARQTMIQDDNTEDFGQFMVDDASNHKENKLSHATNNISSHQQRRTLSKGESRPKRHLSYQEDNTEDLLQHIPKDSIGHVLGNKEHVLNKINVSGNEKINTHEHAHERKAALPQRRGLGSGQGESNDENTHECNNS